MKLRELFNTLSLPETGNERVFNATKIPGVLNSRIAVDFEGNPVLLLSVTSSSKSGSRKNTRLKNVQVVHNAQCIVTEDNLTVREIFTVISFICDERELRDYFLNVSETFLETVGENPTETHVVETLNKFVEIFRLLSEQPKKTAQGLWAELFLIDFSKDARTLLKFWHNSPENKFDFDAGNEKIEVKSNSNYDRIHYFTNEQLNPGTATETLVASVFVITRAMGQSIPQLVESISEKLEGDFELINKLHTIVCRTLGNSFEESSKIRFDYEIASDSIMFYTIQDIPKIEPAHIPNCVTEVKYKSNLSEINAVVLDQLSIKGLLFSGI